MIKTDVRHLGPKGTEALNSQCLGSLFADERSNKKSTWLRRAEISMMSDRKSFQSC